METLIGSIIFLVVIAGIGIGGYCVYKNISNKVKRASRALFDTDNLIEGIQKSDLELEATPRSISSTEPGALPRIARDFPELSIEQLKSMNEAKILKVLNAIETGDTNSVANECEKVKAFVLSAVQDNAEAHIKVSFEQIAIHKCAIHRYIKDSTKANIMFQSSLSYIISKENFDNTNQSNIERKKYQDRITTEWVYWLSDSNFDYSHTAHATCPSCGAPITNMGDKFCQYCGTAVVVDFKKTWEFNNIKQD
ncbi:MAG TPA: zinc ribbon domain-containing protein [Clostridiales bacterium]|nr:zinc ribbon domain-containing protein [Clostridiales bacterium]